MRSPTRAILLETTNPAIAPLCGRSGELFCEMGVRLVFDGLLSSVVEGIIWFGSRLEVHTRNSRYVFEVGVPTCDSTSTRPGAPA